MHLIILDRDGVINYDSPNYIKTPEEWIAIPESLEAIAKLTKSGITLVVCSNQAGLGRGLFTQNDLDAIHQKMITTIENTGGKLSGIFYCPHTNQDNCNCRKPKTQMIHNICQKFNLKDASNIMMVGDSARDLIAIKNAGGIPILVKTGNGLKTLNDGIFPKETLIFDNLLDFSNYIINSKK
jgi:D-glycero-D-manno-heptose 1,7-bisphosphate phosphatase